MQRPRLYVNSARLLHTVGRSLLWFLTKSSKLCKMRIIQNGSYATKLLKYMESVWAECGLFCACYLTKSHFMKVISESVFTMDWLVRTVDNNNSCLCPYRTAQDQWECIGHNFLVDSLSVEKATNIWRTKCEQIGHLSFRLDCQLCSSLPVTTPLLSYHVSINGAQRRTITHRWQRQESLLQSRRVT